MLVLPTKIVREKIVQDTRIILPPYGFKAERTNGGHGEPKHKFVPTPGPIDGAWPGCTRKVQLIVPPSPRVLVMPDIWPEKLGPDRVYKMPPMPTGMLIEFALMPQQWLVAAVVEGEAAITVIVEHLRGGR